MPRSPIHPGEHLAEELNELGITAAELSRQIDVPVNRITGIIHGQRGITADTALRLGHWFGNSPQFWMNLQQNYELRLAENEVGAEIAALPESAMPSASAMEAMVEAVPIVLQVPVERLIEASASRNSACVISPAFTISENFHRCVPEPTRSPRK